MTILSTHTESKYGGKIFVTEPLNYGVLIKSPTPVIELRLSLGVEWGKVSVSPQQSVNVGYELDDIRASLSFGTLPVARNTDSLLYADPRMSAEAKFHFRLSLEDLAYIESNRTDDVLITTSIWGRLQPYRENFTNHLPGSSNFALAFNWNFSQAKWTKFLSEIGYSERWVIEIDKPKLEGFHEVLEHVMKAQEALFNKGDPEDVIRDLRSARESFWTFYDSRKERIAEIIDKGSIGEDKEDSKSKRIKDIYDKIAYFLNVGPHNAKYKVTYADAQLAFREFVSILSYLSPIISELEGEQKKEGG